MKCSPTNTKHNVDPMRYPKVQGVYEKEFYDSFSAAHLFGDVVETIVDSVNKNRRK